MAVGEAILDSIEDLTILAKIRRIAKRFSHHDNVPVPDSVYDSLLEYSRWVQMQPSNPPRWHSPCSIQSIHV